MNTVQPESPRPIAIKSARAAVPGYGPDGGRFGALVPSGVCALIGEAGNSVVAGHVALRYAR
jgi:hypothetical protein